MRLSNSRWCVIAVALAMSALTQRVHAYGGLWSSASSEADPVQHAGTKIIFVDNPDSTVTAVVQLQVSGAPAKFAWVIPVPGTPTVGISSSTVFRRLDASTAPEYWLEYTIEESCERPDAGLEVPAGGDAAPSGSDPTVLDRGAIGPYEYVTLAVDPSLPDPAQVAIEWLTKNDYAVADVDLEGLRPYLRDGQSLVAFKLERRGDPGAIRPVVLTYESERPVIPIRPIRGATRSDVGMQVWVVGPSQAIPTNYKSLVLNDAMIDWLAGERFVAGTLPKGGVGPFGPIVRTPPNYTAVVTAAADEADGRAFVTELGGPASQFRDKVWSSVDEEQFGLLEKQSYADGLDAILLAIGYYPGWDGLHEAIRDATTLPNGVTLDDFLRDPSAHRGTAKVDTAKFLEKLRDDVVRPVSSIAAMFVHAPYLTRLYTVLGPDDMTDDPAFDYNFDLAQVSNVHIAKQFLECSAGDDPFDAAWRIELPQGGVVRGRGPTGWPVAQGSMPANLKIVSLTTQGAGTVVADNRDDIGTRLFEAAGTTGSMALLPPPQNGVSIGGSHDIATHVESSPAATRARKRPSEGCSVAARGRGGSFTPALWLTLAGLCLAVRARRRTPCKVTRARASTRKELG